MTASTVSPKTQALAYRIWAFAYPRAWDVTARDIADALGDVSAREVSAALQAKGWQDRVRVTRQDGKMGYTGVVIRAAEASIIRDLAGKSVVGYVE